MESAPAGPSASSGLPAGWASRSFSSADALGLSSRASISALWGGDSGAAPPPVAASAESPVAVYPPLSVESIRTAWEELCMEF